jgi:hypothetical protein
MTHSACAVLVAAALSASVVLPAYGQTPIQTTTTTQTQTTTTPTETTPTQTTPTETTPESPEPTSAPNEYVESVPTGGGQAPASQGQNAAPAPVAPAPAPAAPATPSDTPTSSDTSSTPPQRKTHRKQHSHAQEPRHPRHEVARAPAPPPVARTPVASDAGEPASPLLLGLALLAITVGVLSTAVTRRQGVGA